MKRTILDRNCITRFSGLLLLVSQSAIAADFFCDDVTGGDFEDPANWLGAGEPPTINDGAIFDLSAQYNVAINSSFSLLDLAVKSDDVTLDLNANTAFIFGTGYPDRGIVIGEAVGANGKLTMTDGNSGAEFRGHNT